MRRSLIYGAGLAAALAGVILASSAPLAAVSDVNYLLGYYTPIDQTIIGGVGVIMLGLLFSLKWGEGQGEVISLFVGGAGVIMALSAILGIADIGIAIGVAAFIGLWVAWTSLRQVGFRQRVGLTHSRGLLNIVNETNAVTMTARKAWDRLWRTQVHPTIAFAA